MKLPCLATALLLALCSALPAIEISEVLPENEGALNDADGSSPGWIELRNETSGPVNLQGWSLTDNPAIPNKWVFPRTIIAAEGYLIVFASGKNRSTPDLHTNFQLNADGEYLALRRPDGTVEKEFLPGFPQLRRNVSYGEPCNIVASFAVSGQASVKYFAPTDGGLGTNWKETTFNDTAWASGAMPLGYEATPAAPILIDFKTVTSATSLASPSGWTGISFPGLPMGTTSTVTTGTGTADGYTVELLAVGADAFLSSVNRQGATTDNIADVASLNNVAEDLLTVNGSSYSATIARGMDVKISGLAPFSKHTLTLWAYDRGSASKREAVWTDAVTKARAVVAFTTSGVALADDAAFNAFGQSSTPQGAALVVEADESGTVLLRGRASAGGSTSGANVFLNALQLAPISYTRASSAGFTNISTAMAGAGSLYLRTAPFAVTSAATVSHLRLRVNYDDGYTAYLNGQLLASRNAPANPTWDSQALADRPRDEAVFQEEVLAPLPAGLLKDTDNVLAIQTLRRGPTDDDMLIGAFVQTAVVGAPTIPQQFYATPTPGAANGAALSGIVADTVFSLKRGFFSAAQMTTITSLTPGALIRYTLDGSAPTATTGTIYATPLNITATTVLRAAAFKPGLVPTNVDTQTYVFPALTATQSATPDLFPGSTTKWPTTWGLNGSATRAADYAMDTRVVTATRPGFGIAEALNDIPTMSLSLAPSDLLGSTGIYQNPQMRDLPTAVTKVWEKNCSIEMMDPQNREAGFAEPAKIEIHGNSSRNPSRMQKHSMRLTFAGSLGSSKLRYRFYPGNGVNEYNKLILRACFTDSWGGATWNEARYRPNDATYFRDIWMRRSQTAMGAVPQESRWVHLYINGLYWGIYNVTERFEEDHLAAHLGGKEADYEVMQDFKELNAAPNTRYKTTHILANALTGATTTRAKYEELSTYMDMAAFADYYLVHIYGDAEDWPHHNGHAWRRLTGPDVRFRWASWDQEIAFDMRESRYVSGNENTGTANTPGPLFLKLREVPEFKLLFADRIHKHLNNDGVLTETKSRARWLAAAEQIDKAIVAESARWGNAARSVSYGQAYVPSTKLFFTRDLDWKPRVDSISNTWIKNLHDRTRPADSVIERMKTTTLYPSTEPPAYSQHGGIVATGFSLSMTSAAGTTYYTTDGTDPREFWVGTARGTAYTAPLTLTQTGTVIARTLNGTTWSARTEAFFIVGAAASANNIVVSELHYNPLPPVLAAERAVSLNADDFEFIELMNISGGTVDLSSVEFTAGIRTTALGVQLLAPSERAVFVRNIDAFRIRYGATPRVLGTYDGVLDNGGEQIILTGADAAATAIKSFSYDDATPWPSAADGSGLSLLLNSPSSNPDHGLDTSWRAAGPINGTPSGASGGGYAQWAALNGVSSPTADDDKDGFSNLLEYALQNAPNAPDKLVFTPSLDANGFLTISLRHAAADDIALTPQVSTALSGWSALDIRHVSATPNADGSLTSVWRSRRSAPEFPASFLRVVAELK